MSLSSSDQSKLAQINVVLSNFQGLQYDVNEDTEYEVIASYANNILSNDRFQINSNSSPEIIIKIPINPANEDEISSLYLHPLQLTLIKHENEISDTIGHCSMDLLKLRFGRPDEIKIHKQFEPEKMFRKSSFYLKAFTLVPLMNSPKNCMDFRLNAFFNFQNCKIDDGVLIGLNSPFELIKNATVKVNSHQFKRCKFGHQSFIGPNVLNNSKIEAYREGLNFSFGYFPYLKHQCIEIKLNPFKFPIFTKEACLALHNHIKKHNLVSIELLMVNSNEHLFGLIDIEEFLYVGCRKIETLVPLYRFHNEIFKSYSKCNSLFYKPESTLLTKNKRISWKTLNIDNESGKLLDDIKALNDEGEQMFVDVYIDLKNSILTNDVADLRDRKQSFIDDKKYICSLTSDMIKSKKIQCNEHHQKFILTELYKSLEMADKSEDIFLYDICKKLYSNVAWMNYAIFNAKREEFDKISIALDRICFDSLISDILQAYLLFKSHKYPESLELIRYSKCDYGEIEELCIMQYVISTSLGIEDKLVLNNFKKNAEIECIYSRPELLWFAARDDGLLSWQNSFIKSAIFFIKIGCYDVAELCLGEYCQTFGININYLYLLAAIDSSKGNFKEALFHLNRISESDVVTHNVNYSKIVESIILNLLHTKNFKKAADTFNTYIQTESCDNFLILFLLGSHFNRTNEFVIAKEFLIQASKTFHCHVVFQELGKCFMGLNLMDLAEKAFLNALQFETDDISSLMSLREIYKIQGRHDAVNFCDYNIQYNNLNNVH